MNLERATRLLENGARLMLTHREEEGDEYAIEPGGIIGHALAHRLITDLGLEPARDALFADQRPQTWAMAATLPARICRSLEARRFPLNSEKRAQIEIAAALADDGITAEREVRLGDAGVIDFLVGGVGVEVKLKGQRRAIYRQCERYAREDAIGALILVTNAAMGFPRAIDDKPCFVVELGRAWL